jgi:hypothetical protein
MSHITPFARGSWSATLRWALAAGLGWGVLRYFAREGGLSTLLPRALLVMLVAAVLHRYAMRPWVARVVTRRRLGVADLFAIVLVAGILVILFRVV